MAWAVPPGLGSNASSSGTTGPLLTELPSEAPHSQPLCRAARGPGSRVGRLPIHRGPAHGCIRRRLPGFYQTLGFITLFLREPPSGPAPPLRSMSPVTRAALRAQERFGFYLHLRLAEARGERLCPAHGQRARPTCLRSRGGTGRDLESFCLRPRPGHPPSPAALLWPGVRGPTRASGPAMPLTEAT